MIVITRKAAGGSVIIGKTLKIWSYLAGCFSELCLIIKLTKFKLKVDEIAVRAVAAGEIGQLQPQLRVHLT